MRFNDYLHSKLAGKIPRGVGLPSGFTLVGHVVLVELKRELWDIATLIGNAILGYDKRFRSVAAKTGPTYGTFRTPDYTLIAGDSRTITCHMENDTRFWLDPLRITFSAGNKGERIRLPLEIESGDTVVDMFSCVGQFALPIANRCDRVNVIAIEMNPEAFGYLVKNIHVNGVRKKVQAIFGDCRSVIPKRRANRIVMGYLHDTVDFLPFALSALSSNGGTIYMHQALPEHMISIVCNTINTYCESSRFKSEVSVRKIKKYAPRVFHYGFDIEIESRGRN